MPKGLILGMAAAAAASYWASRQPGGMKGTVNRLQQGIKDIQAGQDPAQVYKRFMAGTDEEPAGYYTEEPLVNDLGTYQQPYRDYASG